MTSKIMKTMKTMLAFVAGALVLSACNNDDAIFNENENQNDNGAKLVTLTAYQEGEGGTRAAIDGITSTQIDWSENDEISYFGGNGNQKMTLSAGKDSKTGTFSGTVTTSENDYVLYPYNAEATCSSGTITTTIPSQQSVPAGTFDPTAALMVGKVNGTSIQFYNSVGYIAITIPLGTSNITKMVITGNNNERLSGKVTISGITTDAAPTNIAGTTRTPDTYSSVSQISDGVKYVEATPNGTSTFEAGKTYYVAVAPDATLSQGIYVLLYNGTISAPSTLKLAVKKSANSLDMARAKVKKVTLPAIAESDWMGMIALDGCYLAPFNLGATASTDNSAAAYGNYYSFGEVDTKSDYSVSSYTGSASLTDLTDAATSNWGPDWRMATYLEWNNNKSNSSVLGLPLAGYYYGTNFNDAGYNGYYWSSTPYDDYAYILDTNGNSDQVYEAYLNCGCSVRPVLAYYSNNSNWLKLESNPQKDVDVFYILPTCIMQGTNEVENFSEQDKLTAAAIYEQQAKLFEGFCNIYAPYYRQIPINVTLAECQTADDMAEKVRSRAGKDDVFAALDYYFRNLNNGRPFILASHSQGSAMMRPVLDTYMKEHPEYYSRMVACYAIGSSLPLDWFEANPHLKKATDATSTGVVIGWNTEGPQATTPSLLIGSNDYVINPLSWKCDGELVSETENLGSLIDGSVIPGYADAQIDLTRRALICTTDINYIDVPAFGDRSLHGGDWSLYWGNIKQNAQDRIAKYKQEHQQDN